MLIEVNCLHKILNLVFFLFLSLFFSFFLFFTPFLLLIFFFLPSSLPLFLPSFLLSSLSSFLPSNTLCQSRPLGFLFNFSLRYNIFLVVKNSTLFPIPFPPTTAHLPDSGPGHDSRVLDGKEVVTVEKVTGFCKDRLRSERGNLPGPFCDGLRTRHSKDRVLRFDW